MNYMYAILFFSFISFLNVKAQNRNPQVVKFIPQGFTLLDSKSGDLNQDGITDYIVICKSPEEEQEEVKRPLLILHGQANGSLKLVARNDNVVMCAQCGGVMGDPYTGMTLKNNFFSVEHEGGSNFRFLRIMTFKYDKDKQQYLLHKDAGETYNTTNPNKSKSESHNKKLWGKILFTDYSNQ